MGEPKSLKGYDGQTTDQLIALGADHEIWTVVWAFYLGLTQKAERIGEENLTWPELVIIVLSEVDVEVNNGGWNLLFTNSSKRHAGVLVEAMRAVGNAEATEVTAAAVAALNLSEPFDEGELDRILEEREDELEKIWYPLEDRWYQEIGGVDDEKFAFIKAHRSEITLP